FASITGHPTAPRRRAIAPATGPPTGDGCCRGRTCPYRSTTCRRSSPPRPRRRCTNPHGGPAPRLLPSRWRGSSPLSPHLLPVVPIIPVVTICARAFSVACLSRRFDHAILLAFHGNSHYESAPTALH